MWYYSRNKNKQLFRAENNKSEEKYKGIYSVSCSLSYFMLLLRPNRSQLSELYFTAKTLPLENILCYFINVL